MLKAVNLTKKFDDLVAVDHINAEIKSGFMYLVLSEPTEQENLRFCVWQPGSLKQMRAM